MLLLLSLSSAAVALDPAFSEKLTVYHVNPEIYGAAPINMDTADLAGDAFFDLRSIAQPMECAHDSRSSDCTNPEVTSNDLVITKLVLEVDSRFGQYGMCNICVNGSAGISGGNCTDGEYKCACHHGHGPGGGGYICYNKKCYPSYHGTQNETECEATCNHTSTEPEFMRMTHPNGKFNTAYPSGTPCNASVGRENVTEFFGRMECREGSPVYECWRGAVSKKTGGMWYSTIDSGYCNSSSSSSNCTWRVASVEKVINKTCSDSVVYSAVEKADTAGCFTACGPTGSGLSRNTSSDCWITCFYNTVLGPDAGKPGGQVAGMPIDALFDAWSKPFESEDPAEGGCKDLRQF